MSAKPNGSRAGVFHYLIVAFAAWLAGVPVASQGRPSVEYVRGHAAVAGQAIVKLRGTPSPLAMNSLQRQVDVDKLERIGTLSARVFRSRSFDTSALISFLSSQPEVEYAEPDYILYANDTVPNDPQFSQLWGLRNLSTGADIGAVKAWDISKGTSSVVVAVVDTGVDYTHPDLIGNMWSAPASFTVTISGVDITCAAGTHGFNAITSTCDPLDDHDHGTHVAGTIGATGGNGVGVVGVNWIARIMGIKFLSASGSGSSSDAIRGIEFAVRAKQKLGAAANVRVLSNSWGGGGFSQALLDEIYAANASDMLLVAAAGNSATDNDQLASYPAGYTAPNVVAVAATDQSDGLASFSNYGAVSVDLGAPGVFIVSTTRNNTYKSFSGTSMATPHVSGTAALILSRCALDTAALKDNLLAHVTPLGSLAGITVTGGRLNADASLRACASTPAAFAKIAPSNAATGQSSSPTLSWAATASAANYEYCVDKSNNAACDGSWTSVGGATSKGLSGLAAGATYYWQVRARNTAGTTDANGGAWWSFTTAAGGKCVPVQAVILAKPNVTGSPNPRAAMWQATGVSVNAGDVVTIQVIAGSTWTNAGKTLTADGDPAKVVTGPNCPLSGDHLLTMVGRIGGAGAPFRVGTGRQWTATESGIIYLAPDDYWYSLADNAGSVSVSICTTSSGSTPPGAFNKARPLNAAQSQSSSPMLSWGASTGAASYQYCADTTNNRRCDASWTNAGAATSVALNGLVRSATYYWQVRARNTAGKTSANGGTWWSFTTAAAGQCVPVQATVVAKPSVGATKVAGMWQATGVSVKVGSVVKIQVASSDTWTSRDLTETASGDATRVVTGLNCPLSGEHLLTLVGRIGTGTPFRVGTGRQWTATEAGPLYLAPNDNWYTLADNGGDVQVSICVSP